MTKSIAKTEETQQLRTQTLAHLKQLLPPGANAHHTTEELAKLFHIQPNTIRRSLCTNGHYQGLTPLKMGNGRLIWPIA